MFSERSSSYIAGKDRHETHPYVIDNPEHHATVSYRNLPILGIKHRGVTRFLKKQPLKIFAERDPVIRFPYPLGKQRERKDSYKLFDTSQ
jgi:hypothetical protein